MKSAEGCFINRFGLYELDSYVIAKQIRILLEQEFHELEQALYEESPMTKVYANSDLGTLHVGSGWRSLEDFVIDMIEQKDLYRKRIERLKGDEELFEMAVNSLTPREQDVIQVHYFNRENKLGLTPEFFNQILVEAQEKLCSFIADECNKRRINQENERKKQREQLKNDIKSGRVRVV